jgi:hypothetical protein
MRLMRNVAHFGCNDWNIISAFMPSRTPRQCRERWIKYLCPTNSFEPFTPEEDALLKDLHTRYGSKWMKMTQFFTNRTDITLKNRWLVLRRQADKVEKADVIRICQENPMSFAALELCGPGFWQTNLFGDDPWGDL